MGELRFEKVGKKQLTITMIVLRKLTTRPWESVKRPSSRTWRKSWWNSREAFSSLVSAGKSAAVGEQAWENRLTRR